MRNVVHVETLIQSHLFIQVLPGLHFKFHVFCGCFLCVVFYILPRIFLFSGNLVALLHSFFSNLSQEWLEGAHILVKQLRPITSVAMLRIAFRIVGPLLTRLASASLLFSKVMSSSIVLYFYVY